MTGGLDELERMFHQRLPAHRRLHPDTNFFEAGLTSVTLAGIVTELQQQGLGVTLIDMFRYPTLRELAGELARRTGDPPVRPGRLPWQR